MKAQKNSNNGRVRNGWELTKSSWYVLALNKELILLPLLGLITALVTGAALFTGFFSLLLLLLSAIHRGQNFSVNGGAAALPIIVVGILLYVLLVVIGNFFSGAVIFGATQRFNGKDPTLRSSIAGVRRKFRSLFAFSLMSGTVGLGLQIMYDRLPLAGKIVSMLGNIIWSVANVFSVPIIVLGSESIRPLAATKASAGMVKDIWGEGSVVQGGIGLIGLLGLVGFVVLAAVIGTVSTIVSIPTIVSTVLIVIGLTGLLMFFLFMSVLASITKAALYYYATTRKAPKAFNEELLHAALTVKKARRIFA